MLGERKATSLNGRKRKRNEEKRQREKKRGEKKGDGHEGKRHKLLSADVNQ